MLSLLLQYKKIKENPEPLNAYYKDLLSSLQDYEENEDEDLNIPNGCYKKIALSLQKYEKKKLNLNALNEKVKKELDVLNKYYRGLLGVLQYGRVQYILGIKNEYYQDSWEAIRKKHFPDPLPQKKESELEILRKEKKLLAEENAKLLEKLAQLQPKIEGA